MNKKILFVCLPIYVVIAYFVMYCLPWSGYRVYGYICGDENHTMYEDTIIWGDFKTADHYIDSINKVNNYRFTIRHLDYVNRLSIPKTNRVTVYDVAPRFAYVTQKIDKPDTIKTNVVVQPDTVKKVENAKPSKTVNKDNRNIHVRTNGSVDVGNGKTGSLNYNTKTGKFGIRTSRYTVVDSKGIHFSF